LTPPTPAEFERLVMGMLRSHFQMLVGERNHGFEKNLAAVFDAYQQQVDACAALQK
jgi:hypothetical protein